MTSGDFHGVSDDWLNAWQGSFAHSIDIKWLSFCELPFSKTKHLINPLKDNELLNKFRDAQELPWDLGINVSKICADYEKHLKQQDAQSDLKKEYLKAFRAKKDETAI